MGWTETDHANMVASLAKPGEQIAAEITGPEAHLLHMAVGVAGEAGELLDVIKRYAIYRQGLDRAHLIEELGDLEFYLEGIRAGVGIAREEVLSNNIDKLSVRYSRGTYTDHDATHRADKA